MRVVIDVPDLTPEGAQRIRGRRVTVAADGTAGTVANIGWHRPGDGAVVSIDVPDDSSCAKLARNDVAVLAAGALEGAS